MLVSVIIPYYKKKNYIKKSVKSVLNQTLKDFELIIINDEPGIESRKFLNQLKIIDKRIKIINNKSNIGAGLSRNKGIKVAKGKYISFIDSDDIWKRNKLQIQISNMKKMKYKISHTSYDIINELDKIISVRKSKNLNFDELIKSCDIGLSTVTIDKKILKRSKLFSNFKTKEDYYFWLNLAKKGEIFYYIDKPLSQWRRTEYSLSSSTSQKFLDSFKVYNHFGYNYIYSIYRTIILSINFLRKKINDHRHK
tara:strand:+ start:177 stop:932 length:756 start_codon:yes stop_codon:yes gene_type:complete